MEKLREGGRVHRHCGGIPSEGLGIVRLDGAVVFVPGRSGETVDLRITKVMKTAAAGGDREDPPSSPERTAPECPYYGRCGGCDFQHLTYTEELWAKRKAGPGRPDPHRRNGSPGGGDPGGKESHPLPEQKPVPRGGRTVPSDFSSPSHRVVPIERCLDPVGTFRTRRLRRWRPDEAVQGPGL